MSTSSAHSHPDDGTVLSHTLLGHVVVVGAVLQVLASVALSLAKVDDLATAAAEGPLYYVLATLLAAIAVLTVWLTRSRPAVALPLLLGWPIIVYLVVGKKLSVLGLAYHGEFILYHFLSLTCAALCVLVPMHWLAHAELGKARPAPLVLASIGAACLALAHLGAVPSLRVPGVAGLGIVGGFCLLATWPLALGLFWKHAHPGRLRIAAGLLALPVLVRLSLTGLDGFNGAPVPNARVLVLGIAIVGVATAVAFLFRPRLETWARLMISVLCLLSTVFAWLLYDRGFGELEDGFDGLIRSFLGFALPYPAYVSEWKVLGMMVAMFFILSTVYASLVSTRDRNRGVPLALMAMAGLGLTSPHLVLMLGAAALLLIDGLMFEPESDDEPAGSDRDRRGNDDEIELEAVLDGVAARLGFEPPISLAEGKDRMAHVSGELSKVSIDVRARNRRGRWKIELTAGLAGRGTPSVELIPDSGKRGNRPAHAIGRTHRVVGAARDLESSGEQLMDSLIGFPTARVRMWPGGVSIEMGSALGRLDVDSLEALARASARATD